MNNRIVDIEFRTPRLGPTAAEVWVLVRAQNTTATTELRGRFVGPKCELSSTVEVAYPLRPCPHKPAGLHELCAQVVIPEPSLWEAQCPFVYNAVIELWQDGERCDARQVTGYRLMMPAKPGT